MAIETKEFKNHTQYRAFKGEGVIVESHDMPRGSFGVITNDPYTADGVGKLVYRSSPGIVKLDGAPRYYSEATGLMVRLLGPSDAFSIVINS